MQCEWQSRYQKRPQTKLSGQKSATRTNTPSFICEANFKYINGDALIKQVGKHFKSDKDIHTSATSMAIRVEMKKLGFVSSVRCITVSHYVPTIDSLRVPVCVRQGQYQKRKLSESRIKIFWLNRLQCPFYLYCMVHVMLLGGSM